MKISESRIESSSDHLSHSWKSLILPEPLTAVLYVQAGIIFLIILNSAVLWRFFSENIAGGNTSAITASIPQISRWNNLISAHSRITVGVFWAVIGILTYLIFWIIYSLFIDARNDLVASRFIRPNGQSVSKYWRWVLESKVFLGLILLLILIFAAACINIVPIFSQLFLASIFKASRYSVIGFGLSIGGMSLLIYVAELLRHMLVTAWRQLFI